MFLYTCMHHVRTVHVFFVAFSYTWIYVCIHVGEILRQSVTVCEGTFRVFTHKNTRKPLSCWCISNLVGLPVWNWRQQDFTRPYSFIQDTSISLHWKAALSCWYSFLLIVEKIFGHTSGNLCYINLSSPKSSIVGGNEDSTSCKLKHVSTLSTGTLELCWDGADSW